MEELYILKDKERSLKVFTVMEGKKIFREAVIRRPSWIEESPIIGQIPKESGGLHKASSRLVTENIPLP